MQKSHAVGSGLIKVDVENKKSFGKLGIVTVYLTPELKSYLDKEKTKNGETLCKLFERGMALRGFKHLIETVRGKEPHTKIVFTTNRTQKNDGKILINYKDYQKITGDKFFQFYRETGLDAASFYLNQYFPKEYVYDASKLSETNIKKFNKNFEDLIDQIPKKRTNNKIILEKSSEIVSELTDKKNLLKQEIADLEKLRNRSNIFFFQNKIEELNTRLTKNYPETKGKNSWQSWIYSNNWLFGINYQPPIEKQKINIPGVMPDFLFPTIDGFLDILEIKLPTKDIINEDGNHKGSFAWSSESNKAIGQVVNYLSEIELYQLHLKQEIKKVYRLDLNLIKPRAFILIGTKSNWTEEYHSAMRKLNYSLHGIEVLSYSDLLERGKELLNTYTKDLN